MDLSHDALRDLAALAELKSEVEVFERHFLQLKAHVINDHRRRRVDVPSLPGLRMALRVKRIGALSGEEPAADVDKKVAKILENATVWKLCGTLQHLLGHYNRRIRRSGWWFEISCCRYFFGETGRSNENGRGVV